MRCTDKRKKGYGRRRRRRIKRMKRLLLLLCLIAAAIYAKKYVFVEQTLVAEYEADHYNSSYHKGKLFATDLCVVPAEDEMEMPVDTSTLKAAALFDVNQADTEYAYEVHQRVYPASTTKILTALVAMNHADLSDVVTIGKNADSNGFAADEATCGIHEGDQITLRDLLYGLLLQSGNDTAVAIAEYVGGSVNDFAVMMNEQAQALMATNSHFVNPHGLYHDEHYTTAYDLYLIFNECIKHEEFVEIIGTSKYSAKITGADGTTRELELEPTNYYAVGKAELPTAATVVGGKTGTLLVAGNCLILMEKDAQEQPYVSVIMGAETKEILYRDMTKLINAISSNQ